MSFTYSVTARGFSLSRASMSGTSCEKTSKRESESWGGLVKSLDARKTSKTQERGPKQIN
jgi:hypothetical protein